MALSPSLVKLIDNLRHLPSVGPKSAQRMAFHILQNNRNKGLELATALRAAIENIRYCSCCRNFCEAAQCGICSNPQRDKQTLCIVESPADIIAIEQTGCYQGRYFVLMGHISPIDGIGPEDIGLDLLREQLDANAYSEIILATSATIEGEATAQFIAQLCKKMGRKTSRIAHGIPIGGELEYIDSGTLSRALNSRSQII